MDIKELMPDLERYQAAPVLDDSALPTPLWGIPSSKNLLSREVPMIKIWIFVVSAIFAGLLLLANFVAVILYIALYVWK